MLKKEQLIQIYEPQSKVVYIKAVKEEVRIRKLTLAQRARVQEAMFGDKAVTKTGDVPVEINGFAQGSKLAVSFALLEPEMSVRDLDALGDNAVDFINEIYSELEEFDRPKKSQGESNTLK